MRARGRKPRSVWLNARAEGTVTPEESLTLRSSPGTPVYRFHRIRYADEAPMALEYATVLARCLPSVEAVEARCTRRSNAPAIGRCARCSDCAQCCSRRAGELLKAREKRCRGCWSSASAFVKDGRAVEFSQSCYRGDIYDFVAELSDVS